MTTMIPPTSEYGRFRRHSAIRTTRSSDDSHEVRLIDYQRTLCMSEDNKEMDDSDDDSFQGQLTAYRQSLITAEQTMQSEFDKAVMTLSGGALGISFTFLKDIIDTEGLTHFSTLLAAWILWGLSITFILASFFTSTKALRRAIADTDMHTIYMTLAKSRWASATTILNGLGGVCFFLGLIALVIFVAHNQPK
jgi:hypothetical protein